jgi:uncharacterized protein YcnI
MKRNSACAAAAAAMVAVLSSPAFAHMTLDVKQATVGSSYKAIFKVPHGCDGKATTAVKIQIPEGFFNVKPMPKAGWTLDTVVGPYAKGYENEGTTLTEGVTEVSWSGGNLPDAWYDEFVLTGKFAGDLPTDAKFFFPAVQVCTDGAETHWISTSGDESDGEPAPSLTLTAKP